MKEDEDLNLLIDLIKLRKKYGSRRFDQLTERLSDPMFITSLMEVTKKIPEIQYEHGTAKRRTSHSLSLDELIEKIKVDPAKKQCLLELLAILMNPLKFRMLGDVRTFLSENEIGETTGRTRREILTFAIERLKEFPLEKLQVIVDIAKKEPDHGSDLQEWANIIMGKRDDESNEGQNRGDEKGREP